jgi:hypothetical protein
MIHGSAEARLSRLPAMAGIMALFTSILDTARYSIAAKLSGGGRGGPSPIPPPHHPIVRAAPPRKTAPPPTTGRNKSSVFRHFAVGRRSRAAKSRAVAIFTAGPPLIGGDDAYRSPRAALAARRLSASIGIAPLPPPRPPRARDAHASELAASRSLNPRGESPELVHASAGTRISSPSSSGSFRGEYARARPPPFSTR